MLDPTAPYLVDQVRWPCPSCRRETDQEAAHHPAARGVCRAWCLVCGARRFVIAAVEPYRQASA